MCDPDEPAAYSWSELCLPQVFASDTSGHARGPQPIWSEYSEVNRKRLQLVEGKPEGVLEYWRRYNTTTPTWKALCQVARGTLGISASSVSVERLFSQSGLTPSGKRGSLESEHMIKQTCVGVWNKKREANSAVVSAEMYSYKAVVYVLGSQCPTCYAILFLPLLL
jgi:hypothetical protein